MKKNIYIILILLLVSFSVHQCSNRNPLFDLLAPDNEKIEKDSTPFHYDLEDYWIDSVIEYKPVWGQHVNNASFNDPARLYGAPQQGAHHIVSLGSGGGYVIVKFDPPILNHANNIGGYDFIIFGNAFFVLPISSEQRFQEPAYVEVMKDANENGLADDTWYLLKGSDTSISSILTLTYSRTTTTLKPANKSHYPGTTYFPGYPDDITVSFFSFPPEKTGQTAENIWGYADVTPTLTKPDGIANEDFYTVPDTPGDYPIDSGSGGGDSFKIEWAVNKSTGTSVSLDYINFIKIINGATNMMGMFGEASPDIDAVARVKRN